ncbi:MAG TPA: type I restriction enzyme HsdR N-terminal domain-containing protein [Chitinophagaceae bacterium]|nr:type I restriction enzyme HsdR N-terminal domain-containing protein [Chitinophagaceae bacterium]
MNQHLIPLSIHYPEPHFRISKSGEKQCIWDSIRKKNLVLTPEEWVRQNFIQHLIQILAYPASLLSIEKEIKVGKRRKRCDIVVYKEAKPWMIIECKEPDVHIDKKVLNQILNYNMTLQVPYLILTNGPETFGIKRSDNQWHFIDKMPSWSRKNQV